MQYSTHTIATLFSRLGIDNSPAAIEHFIKEHQGIPVDISLAEATLLSHYQTEFLQQAITNNSAWSDVVRDLDSLLR